MIENKETMNTNNLGATITNRRTLTTKEGTVLTLLYLGMIEETTGGKPWPIKIATPTASFTAETSVYSTVKYERVVIGPDMWKENALAEFSHFLNNLDQLCARVKLLGDQSGFSNVKWHQPVRVEEGVLTGVIAKVKKPELRQMLMENENKKLRFIIAFNLLWYNNNKGGVSIEVVDIKKEEEDAVTPKETVETKEETKEEKV